MRINYIKLVIIGVMAFGLISNLSINAQQSPPPSPEQVEEIRELFRVMRDGEIEMSQVGSVRIGIFPQVSTPRGQMVISPEFNNIKNLYKSLESFNPKSKDELETRQNNVVAEQDKYLQQLEEKSLSGRWVRDFLKAELDNFFSQLVVSKGFQEEKTLSEEELTATFWKGTDFCFQGFFTLERMQEYDSWLSDRLIRRCRIIFRSVSAVPVKKRLTHLKISRDDYKNKLIKLIDGCYGYEQKARGRINPVVIGKGKDGLADVLVRQPNGQWVPHTTRPNKEWFESDLVEVPSKEDKETVLMDRRLISLEGEAILTGWEIVPRLPESLYKDIAKLIELLGNDDWPTREKATEDLMAIGEPAIPALKEALKSRDPEVKMRANLILKKLDTSEIEKQVRELIESCLPNRYPTVEQLMALGDREQITTIIRKMMEEKAQDGRWRNMLNYLIQIVERANPGGWEQRVIIE